MSGRNTGKCVFRGSPFEGCFAQQTVLSMRLSTLAMELAVGTRKRQSLRVLFVDDENSIAELMRSELPRMGHVATVKQSPGAAIEAIQKNVFDAAIIDLRMPGGSGWDVIDYLREHSPETVCVISTGHGDRDDAIRAIRMGAYDFLPKPVSLCCQFQMR